MLKGLPKQRDRLSKYAAWAAFSSLTFFSLSASAVTIDVTKTVDDGTMGSLTYAINQVNLGNADTITFTTLSGQTIQLTAPLPPINLPMAIPLVNITGPSGSVTVDGAGASQAFYFLVGDGNLSNLNIQNCHSQGGAGSLVQGGGGGGAGAGAGLLLHDTSTVTISNVNFSTNQSIGGNGGTGETSGAPGGGGGGFCGGSGHTGVVGVNTGGGGGGGDPGGTDATTSGGTGGDGSTGGAAGSTVASTGGGGGGGGGGGIIGGDGGNGHPTGPMPRSGGAGGTQSPLGTGGGGGGGGSSSVTGGAGGDGGFGGGGGGSGGVAAGGNGGAGGFGGGGGGIGINNGGSGTPGSSAFGGGAGGQATAGLGPSGGGGGGAAMGGGIFVRRGGVLNITDGSISGNTVVGGTGGLGGNGMPTDINNGGDGQAVGQDIFLMSGGMISFNISSSYTVGTAIESDLNQGGFAGGGITKQGVGTLFFSNNSAHTYTGGTSVTAGTLNVNGSLIGTVMVANGATFSGNVTLNSFSGMEEDNPGDLINSGIVSPGNSIGTMTVSGNYTQNANGDLLVEIDSAGGTDLVNITGTAALDGTIHIDPISSSGYLNGQTFTFLTAAGGRSGTFSQIILDSTAGGRITSASLVYFPNQVEIVLQAINLLEINAIGVNQVIIARYLDSLILTAGSDIATVITALSGLDPNALNCALNQIQPSLFGAFSVVEEESNIQVRSTVTHRTNQLHSRFCMDNARHKLSVWSDVFGGFAHQHHFYQTPFKTHNVGVTAGLDYSIYENVYLGALGSYNHNHINWPNHCADAHGSLNSYYGGLYATGFNKFFFVDVSFLGAKNTYDATRHIEFSTIDRKAKSDHDGYDFSGNISVGGNWNDIVRHTVLQPFARLDYIYVHQNHFSEHGANSLDVSVPRKHSELLRSELGANFAYCYSNEKWGNFSLTPGVSWVYESRFGGHNYRASLKEFQSTNGSFTVKTGNPSRNLIAPALNLTYETKEKHFAVSTNYDGEFGRHFSMQEFSGSLEYRF